MRCCSAPVSLPRWVGRVNLDAPQQSGLVRTAAAPRQDKWLGLLPQQALAVSQTAVQLQRCTALVASDRPFCKVAADNWLLKSPAGLRQGLWRGTLPGQLLTVPYTAVQFVALQQFKAAAARRGLLQGAQAPALSFVGGAFAGAAATFASYPFDLLRTTLAAQGEPRVRTGWHLQCGAPGVI